MEHSVAEEIKPLAHPWLLQAEEERGGGLTPSPPTQPSPEVAGLRSHWWRSGFRSCRS